LLANIEVDGATVVAQVGEKQIGEGDAEGLRAQISAALPTEGARVAIDLSLVDFLDSSGLGSLVSLLKEVRPTGDVVLYGVKSSVVEILRLTHLDAVFHCAPNRHEALRHLTRASVSA
jgi:anti-sigma B factor antagonist